MLTVCVLGIPIGDGGLLPFAIMESHSSVRTAVRKILSRTHGGTAQNLRNALPKHAQSRGSSIRVSYRTHTLGVFDRWVGGGEYVTCTTRKAA